MPRPIALSTRPRTRPPGPRRPLRLAAVIAAVLSALALNLLAAGTSQARTDSVYGVLLFNYTTHKCLDVPDYGAPDMGSIVQQHDCLRGAGDNQMWDLTDGVDGFLIRNVKNQSLCLDLPGTGVPGNSTVGFYPCQNTTADNQLWYQWWDSAGRAFRLVNARSYSAGRPVCLDVAGLADGTNDLRVGVYTCSTSYGDDHWWQTA
ncbi:RICIN domain-containing protein [Streptomyces sp. NRRL S-87]|uniref:RICIN domain-containing protein n=1 Tax=Streptomyces sp. NRRL S-87 TaxID=1463920 RepID=UPI0004BFF18D|nr:RICIN domain-containing protein [Streptomyces sp. NRRL S-87]